MSTNASVRKRFLLGAGTWAASVAGAVVGSIITALILSSCIPPSRSAEVAIWAEPFWIADGPAFYIRSDLDVAKFRAGLPGFSPDPEDWDERLLKYIASVGGDPIRRPLKVTVANYRDKPVTITRAQSVVDSREYPRYMSYVSAATGGDSYTSLRFDLGKDVAPGTVECGAAVECGIPEELRRNQQGENSFFDAKNVTVEAGKTYTFNVVPHGGSGLVTWHLEFHLSLADAKGRRQVKREIVKDRNGDSFRGVMEAEVENRYFVEIGPGWFEIE